jgi:hypothetical protein
MKTLKSTSVCLLFMAFCYSCATDETRKTQISIEDLIPLVAKNQHYLAFQIDLQELVNVIASSEYKKYSKELSTFNTGRYCDNLEALNDRPAYFKKYADVNCKIDQHLTKLNESIPELKSLSKEETKLVFSKARTRKIKIDPIKLNKKS